MLAEVEAGVTAPVASGANDRPHNALAAGLLKPKVTSASPLPEASPSLPFPEEEGNSETHSEMSRPIIGKVIVGILIVVLLLVGGWGVWRFVVKSREAAAPATPPAAPASAPEVSLPPAPPSAAETTAAESVTEMKNESLLFGQSIDSDGDGFDDIREKEIGTDPRNTDTDSDGLSDGDEVLIWQTNPLNPDTDGDTHADGKEVYNGYDPLGPGRITTPPPGATTTAPTATPRR